MKNSNEVQNTTNVCYCVECGREMDEMEHNYGMDNIMVCIQCLTLIMGRSENVLNNTTDMVNVSEREFYIWKLEFWWIAFGKKEFYPQGRIHIKGGWFWRM